MKKILVIGTLAIAAVLVFGSAMVVYAQSQNPPDFTPGWGHGMMGGRGGYGAGMMGPGFNQGKPSDGSYGPMHEFIVTTFAEALGLSPEELEARLEAGETMWQIAEAQGLTIEEFKTVMLSARSEAMTAAVEAGFISQEQATWMNQRMSQMTTRGFGAGSCHGENAPLGPRGGRIRGNQ